MPNRSLATITNAEDSVETVIKRQNNGVGAVGSERTIGLGLFAASQNAGKAPAPIRVAGTT